MTGTEAGIRSPLLRVKPDDVPASGRLLDRVLREQQTLTAVERFAHRHENEEVPAQAKYYRALIPAAPPRPGQQYAFDVDLDACTGCKACVAGCHSLNGLDEGEVWRTVGLLHGGTAEAPAQQTVTTSCHHCVDPACLNGCPVKAYEKDPVTGIVKHLDDQCIGCQYCTLMCPYDAPKYSKSRGIVRKCDMCSDRLSVGEAPACVQACPNEAIRIRIIDQTLAVEASEAGTFLPGAPTPEHTIPTTTYKSAKPVPRNMLPADFYSVQPEHAHLPLGIMMVLTQLSVGAFIGNLIVERVFGLPAEARLTHALAALALAAVALGAATFHLGRPQFAFRALLGLRTSWMSREILAFSLFAGLGTLYAASVLPSPLPVLALLTPYRDLLAVAAAGAGVLGVLCSAMIYVATRRSHWGPPIVAIKFGGTTVVLGAAAMLLGVVLARMPAATQPLLLALPVAVGTKLLFELAALRHLRARQHSVMKRVARLLTGDLLRPTGLRFATAILGGVLLPVWGLYRGLSPALAVAGLALLVAGELLERYLFFRAAPASRMPGALP